jgi:CheY-specific phosphatase CheX
MDIDKKITQAVIEGTTEIFTSQGLELQASVPQKAVIGEVENQFVNILSFKGSISGSFCLKCSMDFASFISSHLMGNPSKENSREEIISVMTELLNWIAGGIKRKYSGKEEFVISVPSAYIWVKKYDRKFPDEEITFINFSCQSHEFSIELLLD